MSTWSLYYPDIHQHYSSSTSTHSHSTLSKLHSSPSRSSGDSPPSSVAYQNRVKRPMNAFMVWSRIRRKQLAKENPGMHNADLSKILGQQWRSMSKSERQPFIEQADRIRQVHQDKLTQFARE